MVSIEFVESAAKFVALVVSPAVFVASFFFTAPYGRHEEGASWLWGWRLNPKLGWMVMESVNLISVYFFVSGPQSGEFVNALLLSLFVLHYIHRSFIYPLRANLAKPMPISVCAMSTSWTLFNGTAQGVSLGSQVFEPNWVRNPLFIVGLILFFVGMYVNCQADDILINLRKPGDKGYYIPSGSLFGYCSAPNYFGEFLEWVGFALASNLSVVSLTFAAFTFFNLFPRAVSTHKWYKEKFPEYPKERTAFFPFLI